MRKYKFRGKTLENFASNVNPIILKDKWIHGGIVFDAERYWIDMPYYGQILVNKDTIGEYTRTKRLQSELRYTKMI